MTAKTTDAIIERRALLVLLLLLVVVRPPSFIVSSEGKLSSTESSSASKGPDNALTSPFSSSSSSASFALVVVVVVVVVVVGVGAAVAVVSAAVRGCSGLGGVSFPFRNHSVGSPGNGGGNVTSASIEEAKSPESKSHAWSDNRASKVAPLSVPICFRVFVFKSGIYILTKENENERT
jgi:hypothetical protein